LVRTTVEDINKPGHAHLDQVPEPVAAAKRRAIELAFTTSCGDEVGRLLAELSAHLPPRSTVLEIGAGVGVGTAWIASGLKERSDVQVVSVESDERLSEAAKTFPWPPHVGLVTGGAAGVLESLDGFGLIFAHASAFAVGHLPAIVRALAPGGIVLFDELHVTGRADRGSTSAGDALRREVRDHAELTVADVEWPAGVLLAVKRA
jgi:demethylmenaquinone methyltransferase/2-methoxy-6-polyprenyl-1,4-benzoquinol methylase